MIKRAEHSAGGMVYKKTNNSVVWLITQHAGHHGWGFPKGLIGDSVRNESIEEAALREVHEEGGVEARIIDVEPVKTSYSYRFGEYLIIKDVHYFLMEYIAGDPNEHDEEISEARFESEDTVLAMLTYPDDKKAFETMRTAYHARSR